MKKHLTIIGGGFSSWIVASIFADSGYSIDIFEGENKSFGSQQITPNGWEALSQLIEPKKIQKKANQINGQQPQPKERSSVHNYLFRIYKAPLLLHYKSE